MLESGVAVGRIFLVPVARAGPPLDADADLP